MSINVQLKLKKVCEFQNKFENSINIFNQLFPFLVTVARAVELKHNSSLISALANETSKLFMDAANTLRPFKVEISGQWIKYLELKSMFYKSYVSLLSISQQLTENYT